MKLQKQLVVYFGVTIINAALSFVVTSVLTGPLEKADFGRISLYTNFLTYLTPFITAGILSPLSVEYFKRSHDSYSFYFTNAQLIPVLSLLVFTLLCLLLQHPLAAFLGVPVYWIWIMPLTVWWIMINETSAMLTRNNNKPFQFAFFYLGKTLFEISLTILFVLMLHWSWQGRLLSAAAAPLVIGIISIYCFFRWRLIEKQIDWSLIKRILILSLPFIFERLSVSIMNSSGQYFIEHYIKNGTDEVGLYSVGSLIAQMLILVILTMSYAYQPHLFKKLSEGLKNKLHKTTIWFILACAVTVGLLFIAIPFIFHFIFNHKFLGSQKYAFMLCGGCFMWGVYNAFQPYLIYIHKRGLILYMAIFGSLLSLSLNFYMVPKYGTEGAAISSIITYSVMAITCFLLVRKYYIHHHE